MALGFILACCHCALALDPSLDISQYAHKAWTPREGLIGSVRSIVQTPDGYLWLGTDFGLVRFDGVRFSSRPLPADQPLPSRNILSLLPARDGTLWIGTIAGLASWKNGELTRYPELAGAPVFDLLEDHEGTVWLGSRGKLCKIQSGRAECFNDPGSDMHPEALRGPTRSSYIELFGGGVKNLFEDSERHLWAGSDSGLWRWKPGPPQRFLTQPVNTFQALAEGDHATGLLAVSGGILRQVGGETTEEHAVPGMRGLVACHLLRDRDGALWIGTLAQGLLRVYNGKTTRFRKRDGLSGDLTLTLFEDREGSVWVCTTNGVDRFREPAVSTISENQGLSGPRVSVLSARNGSIWIGAQDGGVNRWEQGQMTIYRSASEPQTRSPTDVNGVREITDPGLPSDTVGSLFEDRRGRIWVTTSGGAAWFENGRFIRAKGLPLGAANAILADQHQGVWISYSAYGLFHVVEGRVIESAPWPWSNGKDPRVAAVVSDPVKGGLWVGLRDGSIVYLTGGKIGASFGSKDGVGAQPVWSLQIDHEGTLWAATEGGLSRIKDGRVATLTSKNGLPCDAVHWVMEDDAFSLWLSADCGLLRVTRTELEAWTADSKRAVHTTIFDAADGFTSHAPFMGSTPLVTKSPDGKLWFVHREGVSAIDPLHPVVNRVPPPVHIEQITANGEGYAPSRGLELPPRVRDLSIHYTALSFVAPDKVHFRFKLEPQDQDWREVVNDREAQYSNLAPGNYRFRVAACNNSGVWNEAGDTLDFSIAPAYYQTLWFRLTCVAAFLGLLWALYQYRLHQVAEEFNRGLEARVSERTRIARELHDTLLQSFHGALLRFQAVSNVLPKGEAKKRLESAIDQAAQAITEGRDAIQVLRSTTLETNDLALAVSALGDELAADESNGNPAAFHVDVEGTPRNLHPILRDEVYRIAGEALRNASRHAQARRIEVEIRYDDQQLRVRVRDDGKGIDPKVLKDEGRAGHFGLRNMRERAKVVGGKLEVWSELDAGTEVELGIPASIAYAKSQPRRSWFSRF